jgi:hypothetical protein
MVATTANPESVHASLRRPGRLEKGDLIFVKFDFVPFFANLFSMF